MKKIRSLFSIVTFWVLISALSACSYHSLQPENNTSPTVDADQQDAVVDAALQKTSRKDRLQTDEKAHESIKADNAQANSAQIPSMKQTARQQAEAVSSKEASSGRTTMMSEDELKSVTGSSSLPERIKPSPAGSTEAHEQTLYSTEADVTAREIDMLESGSTQVESEDQEANKTSKQSRGMDQTQLLEEKESVLNDPHKEDESKSASEFRLMPEALDDGSVGESSSAEEMPLIADEDKSGNSNINRKDQDTLLMKEGKLKRFWNLQRQF